MKEYKLDCLGEACPIPLMRTEDKIKEMEVGDVLIVNVDHSCAMKNVPTWAESQGYNVALDEISTGIWNIIIEKTI